MVNPHGSSAVILASNPEFASAMKIGKFLDNEFKNNISWPDNLEYRKEGQACAQRCKLANFGRAARILHPMGFLVRYNNILKVLEFRSQSKTEEYFFQRNNIFVHFL